MIVTCPSCAAEYRVRDDAVPAAGAQLRCPKCSTLFLAHRPAQKDKELTDAIDRLTRAREEAEAETRDLEKRLQDQKLEAERQRAEFTRANEVAGRALAQREQEITQLWTELAQARGSEGAGDKSRLFEMKVAELATKLQAANDELAALRAHPDASAQAQRLTEALDSAQKVVERLTNELDSAKEVIDNQRAELSRLSLEAGADAQLVSLVGAVSPMLWGLDQALRYLEPFAVSEPALAAHVRNLQLLAGVLQRLTDRAVSSAEAGA
jgi:predicted Zn finger-like uncharacterized protein